MDKLCPEGVVDFRGPSARFGLSSFARFVGEVWTPLSSNDAWVAWVWPRKLYRTQSASRDAPPKIMSYLGKSCGGPVCHGSEICLHKKSSRLPWAAGHRLVRRLKRALGSPKKLTGRPKLSRKCTKRLRYFPGAIGLMVLRCVTSQLKWLKMACMRHVARGAEADFITAIA